MASRQSKMRARARARHKNFKRTGVQTHGGTRKNYSKKEATKIGQLGKVGNETSSQAFSRITGGAKNPLKRAPASNVKAGELMPAVKDFNESLGIDYSKFAAPNINYNYSERSPSDISFSDAVRGGARFNEAGRNELGGGTNLASDYMSGGEPSMKDQRDAARSILNSGMKLSPDQTKKLLQQANMPLKTAMFNPFRSLRGDPNTEIPAGDGNTIPSATKRELQIHNFERQLEGLPPVNKLPDQSSTGLSNMSNLIASADPTQLTGLGIKPVASSYDPGSTAYALRTGDMDPASYEKFKASQQTAGGLNIGSSAFGLDSETSNRIGRALAAGPSDYNMVDGGDVRFRDVLQADNAGNTIARNINKFKNAIPVLNMLPDMPLDSMARADSRAYLGYNPNLPSNVLKQRGGLQGTGAAGSSSRRPLATAINQSLPQQQQVRPSTSTTATTQAGVDPNRLLQIQQQAYQQAYNPMSIGGFNPQFRFASRAPSIDYSTYFNYS